MSTGTIEISAGEHTEEILKFVLDNMTENQIDSLEVDRSLASTPGLASEATAITVAIASAVPTILMLVTNLVNRYLDEQRVANRTALLIKAYEVSPEVGEAVREMINVQRISGTVEPGPKPRNNNSKSR